MSVSRARRLFEIGSRVVRPLPVEVLWRLGSLGGRLAAFKLDDKRAALIDNLRRVLPEHSEGELAAVADRGLASYGRYWAEIFRLPTLNADQVDIRFEVKGFHHIQESRANGIGPIMVLPHIGAWEWSAAWLGKVAGLQVTAVAERLEPEDVFDWFVETRSGYGVNVVPLDNQAMGKLLSAVRERHVVCLLADRDLADTGLEVEFFGDTATMPAGPALLSRRSGAPLLPTAVYFDGSWRRCTVGEPIWPDNDLRLKEDLQRMTQEVARRFETLIEQGPDQWFVLERLFASDQPS